MVQLGVWWMKYYDQGRPIRESTQTTVKATAKRKLREREYQIASGMQQGPQVERTALKI
jgi:hypothetical protein